MSLRSALAIALLLLGGCAEPPSLHESVNAPGAVFDLSSALVPGRVTIVHFYADWCPKSRAWKPALEALRSRDESVGVRYVDVSELDSAVARQYDIRFVTNFMILDPGGRLIARDKPADRWVREHIGAVGAS